MEAAESHQTALATEVYTEAGVVTGTAPYMSPEQISGRALALNPLDGSSC